MPSMNPLTWVAPKLAARGKLGRGGRVTLNASLRLDNALPARRKEQKSPKTPRSGLKNHYAVERRTKQGRIGPCAPVMLMPCLPGQSALPLVSAE